MKRLLSILIVMSFGLFYTIPSLVYSNESNSSVENNITYGGIGASISVIDHKFIIDSVFEESAAEEANIYVNDVIVKVNDKNVSGFILPELVNILRGKVGTTVNIVLERDSNSTFLTKKLIRRKFTSSTVSLKNYYYGVMSNPNIKNNQAFYALVYGLLKKRLLLNANDKIIKVDEKKIEGSTDLKPFINKILNNQIIYIHYKHDGVKQSEKFALGYKDIAVALAYKYAGYKKRYADTISFVKDKAVNGDTEAMWLYSFLLYKGYGTKQSTAKALRWFYRSADKGNTKSLSFLGYIYIFGDGVEKDEKEGVGLATIAANKGDYEALNLLISYYININNIEQRLFWTNKAVGLGSAGGEDQLASYYRFKDSPKNWGKAFPIFQELSKRRSYLKSYIFFDLAHLYDRIEKNKAKSLDMFKRAAELGETNAMYYIGNIYYLGKKYVNSEKAIEWFSRGANLGDALSMDAICGMYLTDIDNEDLSKAYNYCHLGADQNKSNSLYNLGMMYQEGWWVAKDIQQAKRYFNKSLKIPKEDNFAYKAVLYKLGKILLEEGNKEKGLKYLQQSANEGYEDARLFLKQNEVKKINEKQDKQTKIFSVIDPKGHTSFITDVAKVHGEERVLTSSKDKTIREWDLQSGKEIRKILGEISNGSVGSISTIALSKDNKYLAVGGMLDKDASRSGFVRIYDYQSGKIVKLLTGMKGSIEKLDFTQDDKYLVGYGNFDIQVWSADSFNKYAFFKSKIGLIKYLDIFQHNNNNYILYVNKKNVILTSIEKKIGIATIDIRKRPIIGITANENYIFLLYPDQKIETLDYKLNKISEKSVSKTLAIDASKNNRDLLTFYVNETNKLELRLMSADNSLTNKKIIQTTYDSLRFRRVYMDDENYCIARLDDSGLDIWDIKNGLLSKVLKPEIKFSKYELSFNKNSLQMLNTKSNTIKILDINTLHLYEKNITDVNQTKWITKETKEYSISNVSNVGVTIIDKKIKRATSQRLIIGHIEQFGILDNQYLIVSGADNQTIGNIISVDLGKIMIYDMKGNKLAELVGHKALVKSFTYDKKHNLLFSSDDGGQVKIWNLDFLNEVSISNLIDEKKKEFMKKAINMDEDADEFFSLILGQRKADEDEILMMKKNMAMNSGITDMTMDEIIKLFNNSLKSVISKSPIASFFSTTNNEWIIWTEDGFFDASKNGAKYIGYHINQGFDKEAKFITSDQVYNEFYRPDIVKKALNKEDVSAYSKEINIAKIIKGGFAPEVKFLTRRTVTQKRDVDLSAKVCDSGGGIGDMILSLNGTNIKIDASGRKLLPNTDKKDEPCYQVDMLVTLQNGKNELKLFAFNEDGTIESDIDSLQIDNKLKQTAKANLYLLSIAVDKYMDKSLHLKYPVEDATSIEEAMQKITGKLFEKTKIIKLYDDNVSKKGIAKAFDNISKDITSDDVFMMFMAGHGVTDDGKYYFLPYDFKFTGLDSIAKYGVSIDDLKDGLLKIPAQKSLVLLDTCNSGAFTNEIMSRGLEEKMAIARLHRATGRNYIAASSDNQVALEGYEGHGVFTYTIVDALEGKGFSNGKLTVVDLAKYVEDVLPEISYKKWGYMQVPQKSLSGSDFPIGLK